MNQNLRNCLVFFVHLVAGKTREGRVMKTLLKKLDSIRKELGSDKVFDVIGQLFEGISLRQYMEQAVSEDASEVERRIEGTLTEQQVKALEARQHSLYGTGGAVKRELPRLRVSMEQEAYRRLLPGYVRRFVEKAAPLMDIGIEGNLDDLFSFSPLKPGNLDWLLPELDRYPTALQKDCTGDN